ncbi:MAG: hypothetical protein NW201_06105 [Gemmatimonadales bacterium]|nr:hypothetical protein [Gemmatimonadales bacterium]
MRPLLALALLTLAASPAAAQTTWKLRADRDAATDKVVLKESGGTIDVTTGPAVVAWKPAQVATGAYRLSATFTQKKAPAHPEAYGLVVGGRDLDGPKPDYLYVLVRGDGAFLVKHRAGAEVHTMQDWTKSPAVKAADAKGVATNELAVEATAAGVAVKVNGQQVYTLARSGYLNTDGIAGLRVNHGLELAVSGLTVTPLPATK